MDAYLFARRAIFRTGVSLPKTKPVASEQPAPDPNVLMRFATLGGAVVTVTFDGGRYYTRCQGCDWRDFRNPIDSPERARDYANQHAGECRSIPKPTA